MTEQNQQNSKFSQFISSILLLPIWIKQMLYVYLRYKLEEELTSYYLNTCEIEDVFQLHKCALTYKGKKEVETRSLSLSNDLYKFLQDCLDGLSIAEITLKNSWTLFETSNKFIDCLEKEFIALPSSSRMVEIVRYMSGRIRIGEYFLRTGQISIEQLENVLSQQEKIKKATNEQVGTATVLVNMGYIQESEVKAILRFKEESRKRFLVDDIVTVKSTEQAEVDTLKSVNEKLIKENRILKEQLRKLLNLSN